ncbi:MAG: hypothetical protein ACKV0T_03920 [Planctomycetales bacterium]
MLISRWLNALHRRINPWAYTRTARLLRKRRGHRNPSPAASAVSAEVLETRTVLASVTWDGGAGDGLWTSAANWSGDGVPGSSDDLTIDVEGDATITVRGTPTAVNTLRNHETLFVEGKTTGAARLSVVADLTNYGTIRLESTQFDQFNDRGSYLTFSTGTLVNAASGLIDIRKGAGESRTITGNVTNFGTFRTEAGMPLTINGTNPLFHNHD